MYLLKKGGDIVLKKGIVLLLVIITATLMLAGCGDSKNSEIAGKWIPTSANLNGKSVKYSDLNLEDGYFSFDFSESGHCKACIAGVEGEGDYTFNNTSVDININGEDYKVDYSNSTLTLSLNYGGTKCSFSFVKQTTE